MKLWQKILIVLFLAAMVFSAAAGVSLSFTSQTRLSDFDSETVPFESHWTLVTDDGEENADFSVSSLPYKHISLEYTVSAEDTVYTALSLKNYSQIAEVWLDGQRIYQYGSFNDLNKGYMLGEVTCLINLPRTFTTGSQLEIRIFSDHDVVMPSVAIGSGSTITAEFFLKNMTTMVFLAILLVIMIIMFGYVIAGRRIFSNRNASFRNLLLSLFLAFVFMLFDSRIPQFFGGKAAACCLISFECFMLMTIPFFQFICLQSPRFTKAADTIDSVLLANFAVINILHFTGIAPFPKTLFVTHLLLIAAIVAVVVIMIQELLREKTSFSLTMLLSIGIFALCGGLQIIQMYFTKDNSGSQFFQLGLTLFALIQTGYVLLNTAKLASEGAKSQLYRRLALEDSLTGLANRAAFTQAIDDISSVQKPLRVGVIYCDLNNMKETNDQFGHHAGDELIIRFSRCMSDVFARYATCYRTGGDEFVALFANTDVDMSVMTDRLRQTIEDYNRMSSTVYPISTAMGMAIGYVGAEGEETIHELIKLADDRMYENKREIHGCARLSR